MASRVGTYLSDDNIKRMCPLHFMPPASKTYELFKLSTSNKLAQRPQNPQEALKQISEIQGSSYEELSRRYIESLSVIKPQPIFAGIAVPRPNQAVSIAATTSMPGLVETAPEVPPAYITTFASLTKPAQAVLYKALYDRAIDEGIDTGVFRRSDIDVSMSKTRKTDLFKRFTEQIDDPDLVFDVIDNIMGSSSVTQPESME